jgi:hypothetical protein
VIANFASSLFIEQTPWGPRAAPIQCRPYGIGFGAGKGGTLQTSAAQGN